jgi:hypothetical protein
VGLWLVGVERVEEKCRWSLPVTTSMLGDFCERFDGWLMETFGC